MFWRKTEPIRSEDYEKLKKEIVDIHSEIAKFNARLTTLEELLKSLRGLVNKKLKYEGEEEAKDINISGYVPFG